MKFKIPHIDKSQYGYLAIGVVCIGIAFYLGFLSGGVHERTSITSEMGAGNLVTNEQFAPFWKAWQVLNDRALRSASSTNESKVWGAIQGLASSYGDPYTVFFPPVQAKMFKEEIAGNFGGVGMEIGIKNNQLVVVSPIKDSPAIKAGVKTGDAILKIEATSTQSMPVDQAVRLIRGPQGTTVKITFLPVGATTPVVKSIVRDTINIPTLDTEKRSDGIFVIKLYSFTAQSPELFRNALREFVASGYGKLVLDLRGNPGGYLEAAWDMASYFLPAGKLIVTEDFGTKLSPNVFKSKGYDTFNSNLKMLVLVDGGSASASEILAGALRENDVAKLVGTKTFGKGSVQELVPITPETSLKVTIARWLTPLGHNLSENGLEPDYAVDIASSTRDNDLTMKKAVELLNK